VYIGQDTAIAGCTGIAGSTHIGRNCRIGGACNIVGHLHIAEGVGINAASLVARSIAQAGRYGSGMPLQPEQAWRRSFVTLGKLDQLIRRIRRLERSQNGD
jgi:UDP-3-O-[3-hydroxymyristoyl] glucosamine N-acyltransferase